METAGRTLDDKTLIDALRESGLGTPATRAATIETLLERGYMSRAGKTLTSTPTGEALIAAAHPLVKSPEMTGRWELRLRRMERGEEAFEPFMREIASYVREVVEMLALQPAAPRQPRAAAQRFGARARKGPRRQVRGRRKRARAR
jgi:DNA topoisomerase-3